MSDEKQKDYKMDQSPAQDFDVAAYTIVMQAQCGARLHAEAAPPLGPRSMHAIDKKDNYTSREQAFSV